MHDSGSRSPSSGSPNNVPMRTNVDRLGLWISLGVHLVVILVLFISFDWFRSSDGVSGTPVPKMMQAHAVDNRVTNQAIQKQREDQRLQQQAQQQAEAQRQQQKVEQERQKQAAKAAEKQRLQALRMEQERAKQAAIKLKKEQEKQEQITKQKEAERLAEAQRQKAEAQARQKVVEAAKQKAAEQAQLVADAKRKAQLQATQKSLANDRANYAAALRQHIRAYWFKSDGAQDDFQCDTLIEQSPSGYILKVKVVSCTGDAAFKQSVEDAVWRAEPLPKPRNPQAFDRNIQFIFLVKEP